MLKLVHEVAWQVAKKLVHEVVWQAPQSMKLLGNLTIWRVVVDRCLTGSFLQIALRSPISSIRLSKRAELY